MSKELINEIESKIAWNDMSINETSISLKDVKRLLNELEKQAERVEEYRSSLEHGAMVAVKTADKLHHQQQENKRYRKALEHIERIQSVDVAQQIARKALEGDSE